MTALCRNREAIDWQVNSDATALSLDPDENMTRQEFAEESDINWLLSRFGTKALEHSLMNVRQGEYLQVDFDQTLSDAMQSLVSSRKRRL